MRRNIESRLIKTFILDSKGKPKVGDNIILEGVSEKVLPSSCDSPSSIRTARYITLNSSYGGLAGTHIVQHFYKYSSTDSSILQTSEQLFPFGSEVYKSVSKELGRKPRAK